MALCSGPVARRGDHRRGNAAIQKHSSEDESSGAAAGIVFIYLMNQVHFDEETAERLEVMYQARDVVRRRLVQRRWEIWQRDGGKGDRLIARKDTYLDAAGLLANRAEAFVEAFAEAWVAPGDADRFADHFEPWFDPDVRFVQYGMATITGRKAFREQFARPLFSLMPDLHGAVTRWAAAGDDVYIELRLQGTIGRRRVRLDSCDRITLRNGKVIERVAHLDPAPLIAAVKRTPRIWPQVLRAQRRARARPT
jgi:limonene-1,2-epoxide hydrolase